MLAEIIAVGREILTGKTLDTNSNWLSQQLTGLGFRVKRIVVVDDVVDEISQELLTSIKYGVRLIVTTGGLGPTFDDKTLEAVSVATGRRLVLNQKALEIVKERYKYFYERGWVESPEITPEREKMAYLPDRAVPLYNPVGAAPGSYLATAGRVIISLPGVPREMKEIFLNYALPLVKEFMERSGFKRYVAERTVNSGLGDESVISQIVKRVMEKYPQVYIKSLPERFGESVDIPVRFTSESFSAEEAERLLNEAVELFTKLVSEYKKGS